MRRLLFSLCLLASILTASASYDVVYWNTNFDSQFTPQYGQKILVSPIYFSNSIAPLQPKMYSCGAVGSTYPAGFIISNMLSGRYTFDIQSTPRSTPRIFVIPNGSGLYTLSTADVQASAAGTGFPSYADITNYVNQHSSVNYITGLSNEFNIFSSIASNTVAICETTYGDDLGQSRFTGTNTWQVDGFSHYGLFAVRDIAMAVRYAPQCFTAADIQNIVNQAASLQNANGDADLGVSVGIDIATGDPASLALASEGDNVYELVDLTYSHFLKTGSATAFVSCQTAISNALAYETLTNHLVWINPALDRTEWGFEDSLQVKGYSLMCSVLRYRACRQLTNMLGSLGRPYAGWANELTPIRESLATNLWDANKGLFLACSLPATNNLVHSIPGSAYYSIVVGGGYNSIADKISYTLSDYFDSREFLYGSVKHFPSDEQWGVWRSGHTVFAPGGYQNGGYWPEFSGWVASSIARVDRAKSDQMIVELAGRLKLQLNGPYEAENVHASYIGAVLYLASACNPLGYFNSTNR